MKQITILGTRIGWHVEQLMRAFAKRGAAASFTEAAAFCQSAGMADKKQAVQACDAVLIRGIHTGSLEQVVFRMDALAVLESAGLPFVNAPKTIEKTVNKYLTTALLEEAHLPVPPTICAEADEEEVLSAFNAFGKDMVFKPLFGSCGNGIARIQSEEEAVALAGAMRESGAVLYLQPFIPASNSDLRLFVLGGEVIASMKREGADWRANVSRGGRARAYQPSAEEIETALKAANAVGADLAGVDLIRADDGRLYVIEVNGCPGWKGLSTVTDVDIAGEIAGYVMRKAR